MCLLKWLQNILLVSFIFVSSKIILRYYYDFNDFRILQRKSGMFYFFQWFCVLKWLKIFLSMTFVSSKIFLKHIYFNDFDISMILHFICFKDFVSTRIILKYFICFNNFISFPVNLRHLIFSMILCLLEQFWDITLFHWFCFLQNNLDTFSEPLCLFQWFYMFQNNFSCLNIMVVLMILRLLE